MSRYRTAFYKLAPSWLTSGEGELVLYSIGAVLDAAMERLRLGTLARFPEYAPDDALPYLGRDRKMVRGINESAASFAARLLTWLDAHRTRGNPFALHDQLRAYAQADVMVRTVDRRGNWFTTAADGARSVVINAGNWDWDGGAAAQWARFWVIIYPTAAGAPWAASVAGSWPAGGTIGTTATPDQVATVRAIVADWKPAGTRCEWIVIAYDAASFDPTAPEPDGTWEHFGRDDGGGGYEQARLTTARYWKGAI